MINSITKLIGQASTVASIVSLNQPTKVDFITLSVHLCRAKLTTRCDDRRGLAKFLDP